MAGSNDDKPTADATTTVSTIGAATETTATTAPVVVVNTDASVPKSQLSRTLKEKQSGEDVKALQQRLTDLGFRPGPVDGKFGSLTKMAVWAFQKLVQNIPRQEASGKVDNDTWQIMQDAIDIQPRRPKATATHLEIYLDRQVAIIFRDNKPAFISHVSSGKLDKDGKPYYWCEDVTYTERNGVPLEQEEKTRECAYAKTPPGVFRVTRKVEGVRQSVLGGMLNPVYFNYGIAIHGGYNVPLTPESHGCIRVPNDISREVFDLLDKGDQVYLWDGVKEPEQQTDSDRAPSWNQTDKEWLATSTTSTTTTTTTTPPSTAAPTTQAPATTKAPPTTPTPTTAPPTTVAPTTEAPPTTLG